LLVLAKNKIVLFIYLFICLFIYLFIYFIYLFIYLFKTPQAPRVLDNNA